MLKSHVPVQSPQAHRWIAFVLTLGILGCFPNASHAQCDGLKHAGQVGGEGAFGSNLYAFKEILLPANIKLDTSFHQPSISAVANGKSDARSRLVASEVPAGICIVPSGDNNANHGWAVGDGQEPRISLVPAVWDTNTNTISQYKFGIRLYCTTGSGELDRTTGGCNAKVDVFYKVVVAAPAKTPKKSNKGG